MSVSRSGIIAVRAINDYRRRDIIGYLGLRYYLDNTAARSDKWANRVAVHLVMSRCKPGYFNAEHFKEVSEDGRIEHRSMFIPGPNESLAEAALLAECARHPAVFGNPLCVHSYALSDDAERTGTFRHYAVGLKTRQDAIAQACDETPAGTVRYADIKKFYPSIRIEVAQSAWSKHCDLANLAVAYRELGVKLLDDYGSVGGQGRRALLTGPMFSHLVANLVFRDLDHEFARSLPARYVRYVDDITLIGSATDVIRSLEIVRERVASLGLNLHGEESPKSLVVPCSEWLLGRHDFRDAVGAVSWMRLIGDLKRYLVLHPKERESLRDVFVQDGIRIPVWDYSKATREPDYSMGILRWARRNWFRRKAQAITSGKLLQQAVLLRERLDDEFQRLFEDAARAKGFDRKRRVPKLRYCAARLIYLASQERLGTLAEMARTVPELFFHSQVMLAIANRNVDGVMAMGTNAAQAAAQPLVAAGCDVSTTHSVLQRAKEQSLAVLLMNGLTVNRIQSAEESESELIRFALRGADDRMMRSPDGFLREVACLHGISDAPRHSGMFERAFDEDEALAMDAVLQLGQSTSP